MHGAREWLILTRTPGLGAQSARRLLDAHGWDAAAAIQAGQGNWRKHGLSAAAREWLAAPDEQLLAADLDWLAQPHHYLIPAGAAAYPARLADIADSPPWLFAIGDLDLLAAPGFAIVGSRNPTANGREHAREFAAVLAQTGLAVVSGLATGIDAAAHTGALDANGMTLAVCGTGLDRIYPAQNRELAQRIGQAGLLVSEFALGTPARRGHFPRRNRIISGLSVGTLVVEAARNSGSLITARLASEQGREVFAIPGSIHNPLARGCHRLIRDGAKLVESADDILEEIAGQLQLSLPAQEDLQAAPARAPDLDVEHMKLLECVDYAPTRVDALVERSGLTADTVSSMLLILELQGWVAPAGGGAFIRVHQSTATRPNRSA